MSVNGVVAEWGVRYKDGIVMGRPNRQIAEQSVADYPGRALMKRVDDGPWITANAVTCPACGEDGNYWEDRVSVHDSIAGFEIRNAGIVHPDGRLCTDY